MAQSGICGYGNLNATTGICECNVGYTNDHIYYRHNTCYEPELLRTIYCSVILVLATLSSIWTGYSAYISKKIPRSLCIYSTISNISMMIAMSIMLGENVGSTGASMSFYILSIYMSSAYIFTTVATSVFSPLLSMGDIKKLTGYKHMITLYKVASTMISATHIVLLNIYNDTTSAWSTIISSYILSILLSSVPLVILLVTYAIRMIKEINRLNKGLHMANSKTAVYTTKLYKFSAVLAIATVICAIVMLLYPITYLSGSTMPYPYLIFTITTTALVVVNTMAAVFATRYVSTNTSSSAIDTVSQ